MGIVNRENHALQKPKQVTYAFRLIIISTTIGLLVYALNTILFWQERFSYRPMYRMFWGLPFLLDFFLAYKIDTGRGWARSIFVILTVPSLFGVPELLGNFSNYPIQSTLSVLSMAMSIVAIILLFKSPVNAWFKNNTDIGNSISKAHSTAIEESDQPSIENKPKSVITQAIPDEGEHSSEGVVKTIPKMPQEAPVSASKGSSKAVQTYHILSIKAFTDKQEAPSVEAFSRDWQVLDKGGRVIWALRSGLFLGIIISLFLPWYNVGLDRPVSDTPGTGWNFALEIGMYTCGAFIIPYIIIFFFGVWAILRPGGRMVELYRAFLVLWLAYLVIAVVSLPSEYVGSMVCLVVSALAFCVEIVNYVIVKKANHHETF